MEKGFVYLMGIKNGKHLLGSSGSFAYVGKGIKDLKETAKAWGKSNSHDEVWMLLPAQYSQKVCEMDEIEFVRYIRTHGYNLYRRE